MTYTSGSAVEYFYEGSENLVIAQACVVRNARQERQDCAKSAKTAPRAPRLLKISTILFTYSWRSWRSLGAPGENLVYACRNKSIFLEKSLNGLQYNKKQTGIF
jgi:hypothetical protein